MPTVHYNAYAVKTIPATFTGYFEGSVPDDFGTLVDFNLLFFPSATDAAVVITLTAMYSTGGEFYVAHSPAPLVASYNLVQDRLQAINIASLYTALAPGDKIGLSALVGAGEPTIHFLGTRLRYKPRFPIQGCLNPTREEFYPALEYSAPA